ncbi:TPA: hypothetical protein ACGVAU_002026 [Vibrio vulnificus]|uniref:acyltransferase n=1 Tax=Vibrio vulnificus TaxID=672 RepID=UPI002878A75A|nr:hypothetical protein [Vibrio vulnificus]EIE1227921.1 hypothetical protein [Vibrio vulnificus]MDS1832129.1 hypothetical protein [Vibrio vulnificus]
MIKKIVNKLIKYNSPRFYYTNILGVRIGKNFKGSKSISFGSEPYLVMIGDDFYSSTGVNFITHDGAINVIRNRYGEYAEADVFSPIVVGNNVFLGMNVIVLPGSVIEDDVIVGAGSIVKGTLEKGYVYAGVPVKKICSIEQYLDKNRDSIYMTKSLNSIEKREFLTKEFREKFTC